MKSTRPSFLLLSVVVMALAICLPAGESMAGTVYQYGGIDYSTGAVSSISP